jgi:hypothetical protein
MLFLQKIYARYKVEAIGPQLVIVDVQGRFSSGFDHTLVDKIINFARGFDHIVYIYDNQHRKPDSYFDMVKKMKDSGITSQGIKIEKSYGFLRNWIDEGVGYDVIVKALNFMIDNNIKDSRDLKSVRGGEKYLPTTNDLGGKITPEDFISLPDCLDQLKLIKQNPVLVGGALGACLKEIELVLKALGKNPRVERSLTWG